MMAGSTAYMSPWDTKPMTTADKMVMLRPVSIIGNAKNPQMPPVTAPTKKIGRLPNRSLRRPNRRMTAKCTA
jgi:hypothetical protein